MSLENLSIDILHQILDFCGQNELVAISRSCNTLRQEANKVLYRNIIAVDMDVEWPGGSFLRGNKLNAFVSSLDRSCYENIKTMVVHFRSDFAQYDYSFLYDKIAQLMALSKHRIYFVNYDTENLRNNYSLTQYLMSDSSTYLEQTDDTLEFYWKNNNVSLLNHWILFECQELTNVPFNPELVDMDLNFDVILSADTEALVNNMAMKTLNSLSGLFLNTPSATNYLLKTLNSSVSLNSLERLSLTTAHSLKQNSEVLYEELQNVCIPSSLKEFEMKASCIHYGCDCISRFFMDWFSTNNEIQLSKLSLINYKFNNSKNNLESYQSLLCSNVLNLQFPHLKELVIDISDYDNLGKTNFSISKLLKNIYSFESLERLIIPDFLYSWVYDLPSFLNKREFSAFDLLLNRCDCYECCLGRRLFVQKAESEPTANTAGPSIPSQEPDQSHIERTDVNLKYLSYIFSSLKSQFSCINQNMFSFNSFLNLHLKPLVRKKQMDVFAKLLLHNALQVVFERIKLNTASLQLLNLGGIQKKYII